MSWGNPEAVNTAPAAIKCEHPDCNEAAHVVIEVLGAAMSGEEMQKVNSCVAHSVGFNIVGVHVGAGIDESIVKRLIAQHETAKAVLEAAKNSELIARNLVGDYAFPVGQRKEGVNNLELSDGRVAKLGHKVNYKLEGDNAKIEAVEEECDAIGNEGSFLVERIITWKADFSKSEYNKLDPDNPTHMKVKKAIDKVLITTNGTPSLEIKEPKAKLNG